MIHPLPTRAPTTTLRFEDEVEQVSNHDTSNNLQVLDCMPLGKVQLEYFVVNPWELVQKDLEKQQQEMEKRQRDMEDIQRAKREISQHRKRQEETLQELETLQYLVEFQKQEEHSRRKSEEQKILQEEKILFEERQKIELERQKIEKQFHQLEEREKQLVKKEDELATVIQQEQAIQKVKDLERKQTQQLCHKKQQKLQKQKDTEILELKELQQLVIAQQQQGGNEEGNGKTETTEIPFKDTWLGSLGYCLTEITDCYRDLEICDQRDYCMIPKDQQSTAVEEVRDSLVDCYHDHMMAYFDNNDQNNNNKINK